MKKIFLTALLCTPLLVFGGYSIATTPVTHSHTQEEIEHGGGCRKDSPAGMCCHAGSKPYHCH